MSHLRTVITWTKWHSDLSTGHNNFVFFLVLPSPSSALPPTIHLSHLLFTFTYYPISTYRVLCSFTLHPFLVSFLFFCLWTVLSILTFPKISKCKHIRSLSVTHFRPLNKPIALRKFTKTFCQWRTSHHRNSHSLQLITTRWIPQLLGRKWRNLLRGSEITQWIKKNTNHWQDNIYLTHFTTQMAVMKTFSQPFSLMVITNEPMALEFCPALIVNTTTQ
jgi:hypothetical protein